MPSKVSVLIDYLKATNTKQKLALLPFVIAALGIIVFVVYGMIQYPPLIGIFGMIGFVILIGYCGNYLCEHPIKRK